MPWYTCEGQMPNLGSLFSPPTMWSYSSDSGWEGWWRCLYSLSHLTDLPLYLMEQFGEHCFHFFKGQQ